MIKIKVLIILSAIFLSFISCETRPLVISVKTDTIIIQEDAIWAISSIIDKGNNGITEYGHCWACDNLYPDTSDIKNSYFDTTEISMPFEFKTKLFNISESKEYYVRSYICDGISPPVYGESIKVPVKWTSKALLPEARAMANSFVVNSSAYVLVGYNEGVMSNRMWKYSQTKDLWTEAASLPDVERSNAFVLSIGGKAYFGGGKGPFEDSFPNLFWKYDPEFDNWTKIDTLPHRDPNVDYHTKEYKGTAFFTIGNKGYVTTGGNHPVEDHLYNSLMCYTPENNEWEYKAEFPGEKRAYATGFSIENKGYVAFGLKGSTSSTDISLLSDIWEYDSEGDMWSKVDYTFIPVNPMDTVIETAYASAFVLNGKAYLCIINVKIGIFYDQINFSKKFLEFNPKDKTLKELTWSYPGPAAAGACAFSINDKGYMVGGGDISIFFSQILETTSTALDNLYEFNP